MAKEGDKEPGVMSIYSKFSAASFFCLASFFIRRM
jgi:hypothetical protein